MRAAGEVRKCAVVLAEALTTGSCKLAVMFCAVVRFDASSQLYSYTHTHTTVTRTHIVHQTGISG